MAETLWSKLDKFLVHKGTGKKMDEKKWAKNIRIERSYSGDSIHVRLHATRIVSAHHEGDISLDTGGYHTVTTKARINEFLKLADTGFKVFQKDYNWFITHYAGGGQWDVTEPFFDGMTIYATVEPVAPIKEADPELEALLAEEEEIQAQFESAKKQAFLNQGWNEKAGAWDHLVDDEGNKLYAPVHVKGVGVLNSEWDKIKAKHADQDNPYA